MICVNQSNGEKSVEPLRTLSQEFNGKIKFGMYLSKVQPNEDKQITIGQKVLGLNEDQK